ncbi:MAG: GHMP kinase, partial [Bacteroidaceae bacterium]|nr:GHMP kinase [Bacteroidaceae bacterium]
MKLNLFVPGRLCLFGEHTDWAGKYRAMNANIEPGYAIVTGLEQGIEAEVEEAREFKVTSEAPEIEHIWQDFSCPMNESNLKSIAKSGSFFAYCTGVASYMLEWYKVGGVHIHIKRMTLPMKSGLSSSAAICVLVARAFNLLYGLNLNTLGEMNIAYLGELRTQSRCGRLDQACAFGVKPNLMTFDGEEIEVQTLNNKAPLHWVFADLCASKDTITILRDLNKAYPFASNPAEEELHAALGELNRQIIERAVTYMREGKVEKLGALMNEAQELFDTKVAPMCPSQLTSPKLHQTLKDPNIQPLIYGGKGVGSQGDGSIQFLAKDAECQEKLHAYLAEHGMRPYMLTINPIRSVRKAIIPVAGFGTRLYPSTRMLKKDFFPIVDKDGRVKPVVLILLEELLQSGIEEVCIVLGSEEERQQYRDFFEKRLSDEHMSKLNAKSLEYEEHILDIGKHLTFVYQEEKRGFGHAVYQCASFANNEPVLLLLGDTLYKSYTNKSCSQQLIELYEKYNKPMVSIHEIPLNMVSRYGIITGNWENASETIMKMSRICEKPTSYYSQEHLGVMNRSGKKAYYSVFGQYILTKEVFDQLQQDIEKAQDSNKEI